MNNIECYAHHFVSLLEIPVFDFDLQTFKNYLRSIVKGNEVKHNENSRKLLNYVF